MVATLANALDISTHTLTWSVTFTAYIGFCKLMISTHTLTWSVTPATQSLGIDGYISTHTLTWSVTLRQKERKIWAMHFNSHAHVERDILAFEMLTNTFISTHTLTWSVTNLTNLQKQQKKAISTHTLTWSVTWDSK